MFPAGHHPMFPYTEDDRRTVLNNLNLSESQLRTDVESIRTWIQKQPHLADAGIEPRIAEKFMLMSKGSVEKAKRRIEYLYKDRANVPEMTSRIKLLENGCTPVWESHIIASAPELLNGSRVTFIKVFDWDEFLMEDCARNALMVSDIRVFNDFVSSEIWVFDAKNITLGHILCFNLGAFARGCWILQRGFGVRISSIHVINCSLTSVMQSVLNICKPIVSKKILERFKFHESLDGLREYLPNDYLPKDYGGDLPSFAVYKEKMEEMINSEKTKQFLIDSLKLVADESKRLKSEYSEDCVQGNFKKLEFD